MENLKSEIIQKKEALDKLEKDLEEQINAISDKEKRYQEQCSLADSFRSQYCEELVNFNVSGKLFTTKVKTLLNIKDTLLYNLLIEGHIDIKQTIELDRKPKFFLMVLDYMRFRNLDIKRLNKEDKADLRYEAQYFEVEELCHQLGEFNAKLEIVEFEFSGKYSYKDSVAGTNRLDDITDKSLKKGICANSPGWITFTLNDEFTIKELDIGGFCGNSTLWNCQNGEGATIQTSVDKQNWKTVGAIPSGFGSEIKTVFLTPSNGKYVKFSSSSSYVGIGYLVIRAEESK